MQHTYGGGATATGHPYTEVSKTVTQQTRPVLEREIAAGHRATRPRRDATPAVGAAGLAVAGAGAGASYSGKRRIRSMNTAVNRARSEVDRSVKESQRARADAHLAERGRTSALAERAKIQGRQADLEGWERAGSRVPFSTRITTAAGKPKAITLQKPGTKAHSAVRNAYTNSSAAAKERAERLAEKERAATSTALRADRHAAVSHQAHRVASDTRTRVTPKMQRRIGRGRIAMVAGGVTGGGALLHGERKRGQVGKSLVELQKGLPRYLRDIAPGVAAGPTRQFRGGTPLSRGDYTYLRVRANQSGREASKLNRDWERQRDRTNMASRGDHAKLQAASERVVVAGTKGRVARELSRNAVTDNTPIVRNTSRRRR